MNGKIGSLKFNGKKIPVGCLQARYNLGMVNHALDCDVSYADIVSEELRAVDREVDSRRIIRPIPARRFA